MAKETLPGISAFKTHYFIGSENVTITSTSSDKETGLNPSSVLEKAIARKPLQPCFDFDINPPETRTNIDHTTGQDQKPNP